jgi:hypothetical protein
MRPASNDVRRHLERRELVDFLDGALPPGRRAHLERCDACRDRAEGLAHILTRAADSKIPEPPPEFWDQFSTRIREAVAKEAPGPALPTTWFRWAGLASAAILVLALVLSRQDGRAPLPSDEAPLQNASASTPTGGGLTDAAIDVETDEAWALVRSVADGLRLEDVHAAGIDASPGSANRAAASLSDPERLELAQLLDDEIRGRGRSEPSQ